LEVNRDEKALSGWTLVFGLEEIDDIKSVGSFAMAVEFDGFFHV
jgi:hypothetical protein